MMAVHSRNAYVVLHDVYNRMLTLNALDNCVENSLSMKKQNMAYVYDSRHPYIQKNSSKQVQYRCTTLTF